MKNVWYFIFPEAGTPMWRFWNFFIIGCTLMYTGKYSGEWMWPFWAALCIITRIDTPKKGRD